MAEGAEWMTFSPLEAALIAGFVSTVVGVLVKTWCSAHYVTKKTCERCGSQHTEDMEYLKRMVRLLCEKQGIPVIEQIELEKKL
jgi:hypothetical protein